ncbi:MAG TPA: HAMP domain-containing sensor histidine kinase [Solirubrobacteraceae bacterium]|jgi:two-component system sensor histidine kinase MprB|nr:HAMP domain-containing sensor histidine kinase [Solirubrobacteraceae bacterium]
MSLRRRITAATALAAVLMAIGLGVAGYLTTRSHLRSSIDQQLVQRAASFLMANHGAPRQAGGRGGGPPGQLGGGPPGPTGGLPPGLFAGGQPGEGGPTVPEGPVGGSSGYFQFVYPSGEVQAQAGGHALLPVDARVRAVAEGRAGAYFSDVTARGTRFRVYVADNRPGGYAVQVALSLSEVDSVLHHLVVSDLLIAAAGVLLAGLTGALLGRAALAPIERFTRRTETISGALDQAERLEETGAAELVRLAGSFNRTLAVLEQSLQAQRHLVADASHELRTPLAALRSNIQIFLESERLPEADQRELRDAILAELDDLTQLVADVLELARGVSPREGIEPVELDHVVREAVERTQRRAPQLRFELDLEPTTVLGASERVARAVLNVVDNARKWSPADGLVELRLAQGTLTVRDHGPGFAEQDLPKVFDRFYRAEQARRLPGSGLGLAIVRQAVEASGGSATAANAPGGGGLITLRFGPASTSASDMSQLSETG